MKFELVIDDNRRILIDSEDKLKEVVEQLASVFRFEEYLKAQSAKTESPAQTVNSRDTSIEVNHRTVDSNKTSGRSWIERAWAKLNRPSTAEEIYNSAVTIGYISKADNPIGAFKRAIRANPHFKQVGTGARGGTLWVLDDSFTKKQSADNISATKTATQYGFGTPVGERVVDYARRVLEDAEHGLTLDVLTQRMLDAGWKTTSPTTEKRMRSAVVAMYGDKKTFVKQGDLWGLVEWTAREDGSRLSLNDLDVAERAFFERVTAADKVEDSKM